VKFFSLTITLFLAIGAFAATPKNVSYKSGDDTVQAIIYAPEGTGPFPGIYGLLSVLLSFFCHFYVVQYGRRNTQHLRSLGGIHGRSIRQHRRFTP
jgi:hypothetical protein